MNRKGVVFHHKNARPHSSIATQKLRGLGWDVHPPYSPDLASSDFHLFRSLQNSLGSIKLTSKDHCAHYLLWTLPIIHFFNQKSQNFYRNGIMVLPIRWQQVIDQNGIYILYINKKLYLKTYIHFYEQYENTFAPTLYLIFFVFFSSLI